MRICTVCGSAKTEQEFFYRNKLTEKLHAQCKQCYVLQRRKTWRAHYHKYGSNYRERAVERSRKIKNSLRQQMLTYLSDKACVRCGISDIRVLEFDHINPATKSFSIARGITSTLGWDKILDEIAKCQILCANCHKIKTASEANWYKQ
jgi:5-methylcytosine-specific restriction endonuclease McrA